MKFDLKIVGMLRDGSTGGVVTVTWEVSANGKVFQGNSGFRPNPISPDFVPFEKVTPELAEKWVRSGFTEADLAQIEAELAPVQQPISGLPW